VNERPDMRPAPEIRLPWSRSERLVPRRVLRPLQEFLATSVASGILLVLAAVVAVAWASWPWGSGYEGFWRTPAEVRIGTWTIGADLRHWVNEGLMTLFFLLVGLEIKREVLTGELRWLRVALLPVILAVSGMALPALFYLAVVRDGAGARGWAIPMATDLVFALGVLALVGASVPGGLRSLLLALAIVDDIGSVVVLAIFYPSDTAPLWIAISSGLAAVVFLLPRIHVRASAVYVCLGVAIWLALDRAGVHPTIAGVVMGLLTPAEPFQRPRPVSEEARRIADETADDPPRPDADAHQWLRLAELSREAVSPLARIEHLLLPWVSFVVVPLFVVANAGVRLTPATIAAAAGSAVAWAIVVARVGGKVVGIWGGAALAAKLGVAEVPAGVRPAHLAGMAAAAGAGFTVSLFVAEVAFGSDSPLLAHVKIALLAASIVSAIIGYGVLRRAGSRARASHAAAEVS
jgi:Na+:H+ antiporter, NhaA family